jgi:molybdopterin/thiamine biosynthesis adenylyltransferase
LTSWWQRFPGRLEAELKDFSDRGLDFELDEELFRAADRVLLRGKIEVDNDEIELEVLYPDLFPYMRPEVFAPGLGLTRHQNPRQENLCLLDRGTRNWLPSETGAWLVAERVPKLLHLYKEGGEAMTAGEVPQGEPASVYFHSISGTALYVPAPMLELDPDFRAGSGQLCFMPVEAPSAVLRALLCELSVRTRNRKRKVLAKAEEKVARRFGGESLQIRWARLDERPAGFEPDEVFAAADAVQAGFGKPPWQRVRDGEVAVTAVVFPEEVRQGEMEDTWLFAVRARRRISGVIQEGAYVARGERLTPEDLAARIPKLEAMPEAVVSQLGLGAIGAPLALEFARNQVGKLRLLEGDDVEAAQTVRWPFGLDAVGRPKLETLAQFVERNYPFTDVERFAHKFGSTALDRQGREENELDLLNRFLDGSSLVVDVTAERGVQQLVSDFSRERDLIQLYASATEGARGGHVALIVPGAGGCWHCWKLHADHRETQEHPIPLPPLDESGTVQPRGCASPTFTGASFDLLPIVAQTARVAAKALDPNFAPASAVFVCSIPADGISPPRWEEYPVPVHRKCPYCQEAT